MYYLSPDFDAIYKSEVWVDGKLRVTLHHQLENNSQIDV